MSYTAKGNMCRIVCWGGSVLAGVVLLIGISGSVGFLVALMAAAALVVLLGLVLTRLLCMSDGVSTTDMASNTAEGATSAAAQAGAAVAEKTNEASAAAKATAGEAAEVAKEAVDKGAEAAGSAKDSVAEAADKAGEAVKSGVSAQPEAAAIPDYDGDGVKEGTNEGSRPEALSAPKGGKADNLKEIKGVGPKLETLLNEMGFYHFDQIANWGVDEVAWVDANLKGFKGRVSRDNWVEQAKVLASGGETEFSKRVEDGGVY